MNETIENKIQKIIACPHCHSSEIVTKNTKIECQNCSAIYEIKNNIPILIPSYSQVLNWYKLPNKTKSERKKSLKDILFALLIKPLRELQPPERVWTHKSQKVLRDILENKSPDHPNSVAVLIGAGLEPVYQKICNPYQDIIRIGLAHKGEVNIYGETCFLPIKNESVDLIFSSSVLEHVYNPEGAIAEMYRVLKMDGYVYAEIPFMRGYHMAPIDYQRYTISGIEEVFARHGFELIEKGICSGPFNALVLIFQDSFIPILSLKNKYILKFLRPLLKIILHPIKYLDRLFENSNWAEITACNFYYLGRKIPKY